MSEEFSISRGAHQTLLAMARRYPLEAQPKPSSEETARAMQREVLRLQGRLDRATSLLRRLDRYARDTNEPPMWGDPMPFEEWEHYVELQDFLKEQPE